MPPKHKKGRKVSKKAKKQQEEDEKRLREAEEARLRAEREEQERLERERKQKEIEKLEQKDLERRDDELKELHRILEENNTAVTKWHIAAEDAAEWERYMRCDGAPDPAIQREVNTYMSLWIDNQETDINQVLRDCSLGLELVDDLEEMLIKTNDPLKAEKYQESLTSLQELIHAKHNFTSEALLKNASDNLVVETGNMQTVVKDDKTTICLWANFKKNPRFKGFTFEEVGLGFSLPRRLAVSDIVVRILHTHYDHLSIQTKITHHFTYPPSFKFIAEEKINIIKEELRKQAEATEQIEEVTEEVVELEPPVVEEEVQPVKKPEETKETKDVKETKDAKGAKEAKGAKGGKGSKRAGRSKSRKRSGQAASEGRKSEILTQVEALGAESDHENPPTPTTIIDPSIWVVDLMQYTPLGGIFFFDMFTIPPQNHKINGWEIKQLSDTGLKVFEYPTKEVSTDEQEALDFPPVGVSVKLPDFVVFFKPPVVARWNDAEKEWRKDGITEVSYEEAEAKISFLMESFQPFVLMQETYAILPFKNWEIYPQGQDLAVFTVKGVFINLSITIKNNQCMLETEQEHGLSHLVGKWMSSPVLQKAMLKAGINIFVNELTDKYVNKLEKDMLTEYAAYEEMALYASACAFSHSKWNAECGAEDLILQACEHLLSKPVPKESWSLYMLKPQRFLKLDITEKSEAFSPDHSPGSEFHSTFIHLLRDTMSPEGIARTKKSDNLFVDTVKDLLCATRPLVYAKSPSE